jgi:major membrane immunogen (membrane-anchored lipoprotein)
MKKIALFLMVAAMIGLVSCKEETTYEDGSYKAEASDYHYGWKAFMEATIDGDELTVVSFDYTNEDGDLKTGTTQEDYNMTPHPSVWCPEIESQLMSVDILSYAGIDGITGATGGSSDADALFELILDAALDGDETTQILAAE